jgi:hypothetical protein
MRTTNTDFHPEVLIAELGHRPWLPAAGDISLMKTRPAEQPINIGTPQRDLRRRNALRCERNSSIALLEKAGEIANSVRKKC